MIKTVNLQKIFKTEEVQTLALNDVNIEEEFYKLKYCSTVVYMVPRA